MRAPESRLHLFVLSACVAGCIAVSMWPRQEPLPTASSVGADVRAALERTLGLGTTEEPVLNPVPSRLDHRDTPTKPAH